MMFTIRDIENLSGIKAHTIRIWEQRYSFLKPKRSCTNIRFYNSDDLKVILNISLLNKHGYKISQIDKMSRETIFENVLSLADAEAKTDIVVNQLLGLMVAFDEIGFEKAINKYIAASGIEKAILEILFPFLDKVGILWLTNHINPAQERLISNVIRQKIITGIDSLVSKITSSSKICLFLPEGEYHEISLLYIAFLLKKKGVSITYLGANIPLAELKTVVDVKKPDYLYTHVTTTGHGFNFEKFVASMNKEFKNITIIISGRLTSAYVKKIPQKITFKKSLADVKEFINSL